MREDVYAVDADDLASLVDDLARSHAALADLAANLDRRITELHHSWSARPPAPRPSLRPPGPTASPACARRWPVWEGGGRRTPQLHVRGRDQPPDVGAGPLRLAVDGGGYAAAREAFETANHVTALTHDSLAGKLSGYAGMAGHDESSAEFAAAYEAAAGDAFGALGDLIDAFAALGHLTAASLANHRDANVASIYWARTSTTEAPSPR